MRRRSVWMVLGCGAMVVTLLPVGCGSDEESLFGNASTTAQSGTTASASTGAGGTGTGGAGVGGSGGAGTGGEATTSTTSSSSSTGQGGGTCADFGDPCTQCELAECPTEYCGCYDNAECGQLALCIAGCGANDAACKQGCWTDHEGGISDGALLVHCAGTTCAEACPGAEPLAPCGVCLYGNCPAVMNTCIANAECVALLACLAQCPSTGCENQCYANHPDGLADAADVGECAQAECAAECPAN
jgi:hypothetical protein